MLRHGKIIVLILLICLGITGYFLWNQMREGQYTVWVANQEILPGVQITETMIKAVTVNYPIASLSKEAIVGKTAAVRIPKGAAISTGVDVPRTFSGSLVNIPVNIEMTGLVGPGDMVELVGLKPGLDGQKLDHLGQAQVAAVIDKKGQVHRFGPVNELPAVLVVEVGADKVAGLLDYAANGKVYPVLGGVEINVAPNDGQ